MKELRLEYQKETGTQIGNTIDQDAIAEIYRDDEETPQLDLDGWLEVKEYIEWLEEKLLDDDALFVLMNKILNEKNSNTTRDKTQEHVDGPDE